MAIGINFPSNPTANQSYTWGSKTWIYNGYGWKLQTSFVANSELSSFSTLADGATSTYSLGFTPISNAAIFVSVGGIVQNESDYVINASNNTISLAISRWANTSAQVAPTFPAPTTVTFMCSIFCKISETSGLLKMIFI